MKREWQIVFARYRWVIYFAGPKSRWSCRIHSTETIARGAAPWRWLARLTMLSVFRNLDDSVCGYALQHGECIEHYDPPLPEPDKPLAFPA